MLFSENVNFKKGSVVLTDKHGKKLSSAEASKKIRVRLYNWWLDFKLYLLHAVSLHLPFWSLRKIIFIISGVKIGKGTTIHMGCKFFEPRGVKIGEDTKIGDNAFLDGRAALVIGNHVDIASNVMIYNSEHDIESEQFAADDEAVTVGDYVFIGPRAIILPGVKIGKGAIVAAAAVVTKDVEDFKVVGGIPAKIIKERKNRDLHYVLGRARLFQ